MNTFPRLFTDFLEIVGMGVPRMLKRNLSMTLPFLSTSDLDFPGLNRILANPISFSSPCRIHLLPGIDSVVGGGGWCIPDFVRGPRNSGTVDFAIMFIAKAKRITVMIQPMMIPTSGLYHSDVTDPAETLILN